jgi:hypothetical protein
MDWPAAEEITEFVVLPDGYRIEQLKRTEIPTLIEAIKLWHPDIGVGTASCYLREDFYTEKVSLDREVEKDVIVVLIKYGDELAAMGLRQAAGPGGRSPSSGPEESVAEDRRPLRCIVPCLSVESRPNRRETSAARPNPALNRTRRLMASTWRTSARRAGYPTRYASQSKPKGSPLCFSKAATEVSRFGHAPT